MVVYVGNLELKRYVWGMALQDLPHTTTTFLGLREEQEIVFKRTEVFRACLALVRAKL